MKKANMKKETSYQDRIENKATVDWKSKKLWEIIRFYLEETPAYNDSQDNLVSRKGKTFKSYGWEGGNKFKILKNLILTKSCTLKDFNIYKSAPIESRLKEVSPPIEYCAFVTSNSEINSLIISIRHALAHGGFYQIKYNKQKIYILKNIHKGKLKAEIVLYEETLIKWIDIIKAGPVAKEK